MLGLLCCGLLGAFLCLLVHLMHDCFVVVLSLHVRSPEIEPFCAVSKRRRKLAVCVHAAVVRRDLRKGGPRRSRSAASRPALKCKGVRGAARGARRRGRHAARTPARPHARIVQALPLQPGGRAEAGSKGTCCPSPYEATYTNATSAPVMTMPQLRCRATTAELDLRARPVKSVCVDAYACRLSASSFGSSAPRRSAPSSPGRSPAASCSSLAPSCSSAYPRASRASDGEGRRRASIPPPPPRSHRHPSSHKTGNCACVRGPISPTNDFFFSEKGRQSPYTEIDRPALSVWSG